MEKFLKFGLMGVVVIIVVIGILVISIIGKPMPVVKSVDCNEKLELFNAFTESNVLVINNGNAGDVIIDAKFISKKGSTYSDTKTMYMGAGESKYVNFVFDTSWGEGGSCTASAIAK